MTERLLSCLIGYLFGCFLTAELVTRRFAGKAAAEVGDTGNPGMANVMAALGFNAGILVLLGDLLKCALAAVLSWLLFGSAGWIVTLYAGLGCTLGHDFPFWRGFRGGKGVATSCLAVGIYSFWWGLLANVAGMLVAFATKYLCIAGPVIPLLFAGCMLLAGDVEAASLAGVMTLLALLCHGPSILGIRRGTTKQTDVLGAIFRKKKQKPPAEDDAGASEETK